MIFDEQRNIIRIFHYTENNKENIHLKFILKKYTIQILNYSCCTRSNKYLTYFKQYFTPYRNKLLF